jgi:8-oxo-dGTP pyrophosphatase MutT (NUDIX family)
MIYNEQYHHYGRDGRKYWGKAGAGIIFTDGKKILLLKRAEKGDSFGKWSVPGGKVENGENILDAAQRESKEECGYFGGYKFGHYDDADGRHHFHTFFYAVDKPFDVTLSDEHSDYKWIDLNDVSSYNLHPRLASNWPYFKNKIVNRFPQLKSFKEWVSSRKH